MTLSIPTLYPYADCFILFVAMLSVVMVNVIMLNKVMLSFVMLNVMATSRGDF